ncbi:MAG: DNA repair protein RadC [Clostridia bacterium]|jgi:DNA repair protein RadC|nr:DNA repair protein RadC [Clostridia bacterium]
MNIKELPSEERPVEKLLSYGSGSLSNSELLAVLLGSGVGGMSAIGLAERVLTASGGLAGLCEMTAEDLMDLPGIGPKKAATMICAMELGRRTASPAGKKRKKIGTPSELADFFMEDMRHLKKEHFKVLLLNVRLEVIGLETVSIGDLAGAPVHPRETFEPAIRKGAAAVCFAHNHPSGDPEPSDDDINVTKRLMECGDILGIRVLDHIIIGDGTYRSMKEAGFMNRA